MLEQLGRDEDAVRYPPLPRWFFPLQAAAVACLLLAQMLAPSDARHATFAVAVASVVLGARYWLDREGVSWVSVRLTDMIPFLASILATCVLCWVVADSTGAPWVWAVGAAVAAAVVLHTGRRYRRDFGDDA